MERSVDSASPGRARGAECRATARQNEDVIKFIILSPYIILETTSTSKYVVSDNLGCHNVFPASFYRENTLLFSVSYTHLTLPTKRIV